MNSLDQDLLGNKIMYVSSDASITTTLMTYPRPVEPIYALANSIVLLLHLRQIICQQKTNSLGPKILFTYVSSNLVDKIQSF